MSSGQRLRSYASSLGWETLIRPESLRTRCAYACGTLCAYGQAARTGLDSPVA
ncbi:MAG: hypothetical protein KME57_28020 [Scytonema hyalinum WJT4-NPBG1]|nr:hypothetical protein [Scytonema hyalinum WJT4-NPBG1]